MKNSQKKLIVIILIILIIIGAYYFYKKQDIQVTDNNSSVAGLKTYSDDKNNFQIKYPSNLSVTDNPYGYIETDGIIVDLPINKTNTTISKAYIYTKVYGGGCSSFSDIEFRENIKSPVTINNIPFVFTTGGDSAMGTSATYNSYRTDKNNKCYVIGLSVLSHRADYSPVDNHVLTMEEKNQINTNNKVAQDNYLNTLKQVANSIVFN